MFWGHFVSVNEKHEIGIYHRPFCPDIDVIALLFVHR